MGAGLKTLSSKELISIFAQFGFLVHGQKGSHIKLRRHTVNGSQTLIIPERKEIATGTLRTIFRQATLYIPQDQLSAHFYNNH